MTSKGWQGELAPRSNVHCLLGYIYTFSKSTSTCLLLQKHPLIDSFQKNITWHNRVSKETRQIHFRGDNNKVKFPEMKRVTQQFHPFTLWGGLNCQLDMTWEGSLNERLSRSGWSLGMSVGDSLDCFNWCGKAQPENRHYYYMHGVLNYEEKR